MATEITTATAETSLASTDYLLGYSPGAPDTFKRFGITSLSALSALTPAVDRLPYFTGASTASITTLTAAGRAILDDADAAAQRTTLAAAGTGVANTFTESQTINKDSATALVVKQASGGGATILGVATSGTNEVTAYKLAVSTSIIMQSGQEVAGSGYSAFNITNPTLRWPSNSPDLSVKRASAKVVDLTDGASGGGTLRSIPLTPAQITSNQNDYAPGVARFYRLSTDASRDITGLSILQVNGQEFEIWNVGSNNLVLKHQDAASTAANRFICTGAADITLAADEIALVRYDATTARYRVRKV